MLFDGVRKLRLQLYAPKIWSFAYSSNSILSPIKFETDLIELKFDHTNKWYMHHPTSVLENDT